MGRDRRGLPIPVLASAPEALRAFGEAIIGRDYPVVQGTLLLLGFAFVLLNLAIDILYTFVDPRVRYG